MGTRDYYAERLAGARLRRCYEVAPPRVREALRAEIGFVLRFVAPESSVVELGCGYGRVLEPLARRAGSVLGVDTSLVSLRMAGALRSAFPTCGVAAMDASRLALADGACDVVVCVQNGLSAFAADQRSVVREACRVTRVGGTALFSSYAPGFWRERLEWFRVQAEHGLIGEIDEEATGGGIIVCRDGFRATTLHAGDFRRLIASVDLSPEIVEVDGSTLFCVVHP